MEVFVNTGYSKVQIKGSMLSLFKDNGSGEELELRSKGSNVLYYYEGIRMGPTTVMAAATEQVEPTARPAKIDFNNAHDKFGSN